MLFIIISLFSWGVIAESRVNLLSWWGYIGKEEIGLIEKKCKVKLSVDEYYSNAEFLRRWDDKKTTHDIIIYSKTIQNVIRKSVQASRNANRKVYKYHPSIVKKIEELELEPNTKVFLLSLTGFLSKSTL